MERKNPSVLQTPYFPPKNGYPFQTPFPTMSSVLMVSLQCLLLVKPAAWRSIIPKPHFSREPRKLQADIDRISANVSLVSLIGWIGSILGAFAPRRLRLRFRLRGTKEKRQERGTLSDFNSTAPNIGKGVIESWGQALVIEYFYQCLPLKCTSLPSLLIFHVKKIRPSLFNPDSLIWHWSRRGRWQRAPNPRLQPKPMNLTPS